MDDHQQWTEFLRRFAAEAQRTLPDPARTEPVKVTLPDGRPITLRREEERDIREVEILTRDAFWKEEARERLGGIGADEHYLVHVIRPAPECVPALDYVAEVDGRLAGHVLYSLAYVRRDGMSPEDPAALFPAVTFGPLSVAPAFQRQGVGSTLMRHTLRLAAEMGYRAVLLYGHPTYYPRFGFREAKDFGIRTHKGENFPAFMAMELFPEALRGVTGTFHESPQFWVDAAEARAYDALFPPKVPEEVRA